jgi:hypothetical protein
LSIYLYTINTLSLVFHSDHLLYFH